MNALEDEVEKLKSMVTQLAMENAQLRVNVIELQWNNAKLAKLVSDGAAGLPPK